MAVYKGLSEEYKTFCSLECASAINSYLDYRRRCGEQITPNSYLVRKQFDKEGSKVSSPTDPPAKHKLSLNTLQAIIYDLIYDSGIRNYQDKKTRKGDRHASMAAHGFRKFFQNKCLESGVDPFYVSVLMGHKAGIGVERHYYRPESINGEYSLLELYAKKAMPYLTISDEQRLKLKNRELEQRMQAEESRFKQALAETQTMNQESITELSTMFIQLKNEVEELRKERDKAKAA